MSDRDVVLIMPLAAGRAGDLLDALAGHVDREDDNLLKISIDGKMARFLYHKVSADGVDAVAIPSRPSSGTDEKWNIWVLMPDSPMPPSWVKAFRDRLAAWAAPQQPTAQGKWHLLGPYTWARFVALAPAGVVAAVKADWAMIWKGSAPTADEAALQDDVDLED